LDEFAMTLHSPEEEIQFFNDLAKGRLTTKETSAWEVWNYSAFSPWLLGSLASSYY